jgi:hypothetical protein
MPGSIACMKSRQKLVRCCVASSPLPNSTVRLRPIRSTTSDLPALVCGSLRQQQSEVQPSDVRQSPSANQKYNFRPAGTCLWLTTSTAIRGTAIRCPSIAFGQSEVQLPTCRYVHEAHPEGSPRRRKPAPKEAHLEGSPRRRKPAPKEAHPEGSPRRRKPAPKEAHPEGSPRRRKPTPKEAHAEGSPRRRKPTPKEAHSCSPARVVSSLSLRLRALLLSARVLHSLHALCTRCALCILPARSCSV